MIFFLLALSAALGELVNEVVFRMNQKAERSKEILWYENENEIMRATYFHNILTSKIHEMEFDLSTPIADWLELLPVCQYSDNLFLKTHPLVVNFVRTEARALSVMPTKA
jgi:hypothetical protein